MIAIASAPAARPQLTKFWTSHSRDWNGHLTGEPYIRIEWLEDGVVHTSAGNYIAEAHAISWAYDQPPLSIDSDACDCAADCGESARVRGAEFGGHETQEQMCRRVESVAYVAAMAAMQEVA